MPWDPDLSGWRWWWDEDCPPWHADAACRTVDAELFFAEGKSAEAYRARRAAQLICAGCPVLMNCADYAAKYRPRHGVWAGLTPAQRGLR